MRVFPKLRSTKLKSLLMWTLVVGIYMFLIFIFLEMWYLRRNKSAFKPVVLSYVVVHFDLKGTPLKLSYLESLLPRLREAGANSLLMEYEDMFPYEGRLVNLSAENCYGKAELKKFLTLATNSGFDIIPLVQTFGHMEHVLKLAEFQHVREVRQHPDSICPSSSDAMLLLKDMIQQVMRFHDNVSPLKFIHIGCDEVYNLNKCRKCLHRNMSNIDVFLHHVRTLSDVVKSLNTDTTVLIWDDMLRGIKPKQWTRIGRFDNVQPVYWDYRPYIEVNHLNLLMYHNKFKQIWIASAFKGADGRVATFPVLQNRFMNVFNWMTFIRGYRFGAEKGEYNFKGMILTGWSRYSHMDPPCELLPIAYPSLMITLLVVKEFRAGDMNDVIAAKKTDKLKTFIDKHLTTNIIECVRHFNFFDERQCKFDGQHLFIALAKYSSLDPLINNSEDDLGLKHFEYYAKIGTINSNNVYRYITTINSDWKTGKEVERFVAKEMSKYYEEDFVIEYVNYKTNFDKKMLESTLSLLNSYLNVQTWPRRTKNSSFYSQDFPVISFFNKTFTKR